MEHVDKARRRKREPNSSALNVHPAKDSTSVSDSVKAKWLPPVLSYIAHFARNWILGTVSCNRGGSSDNLPGWLPARGATLESDSSLWKILDVRQVSYRKDRRLAVKNSLSRMRRSSEWDGHNCERKKRRSKRWKEGGEMMERSEESENRKDKLLQRGFAVGN